MRECAPVPRDVAHPGLISPLRDRAKWEKTVPRLWRGREKGGWKGVRSCVVGERRYPVRQRPTKLGAAERAPHPLGRPSLKPSWRRDGG